MKTIPLTAPQPRPACSRFSRVFALCALICLAHTRVQALGSLVLAEVYGGGGNTGATFSNDFVVVFNPTASGVDVSGWSIQYASSAGTNWQVQALASTSTTIPAGGYFLVKLASGGAVGAGVGAADSTGSINLSAANGKVALCNSTNALTGACPTGGSIIDIVGFGTANCSEGAAAAAGSNTASVQRKSSGCTDTDNNSSDFATATPAPRNSATPVHSCGGGTGPLGIANQPVAVTANANGTAVFSVTASGAGPYTYVWHKAGSGDLADGGNISGATTEALSVSRVLKADEGDYSVTISNLTESTNSASAHLTVIDPVMKTQPGNRTLVAGDIADVFASALGTTPMTFQWYQNGNPVPTGTYTASSPTNSFTAGLTNTQPSDAGDYFLVASNSFGAVTSSVATVTVFPTPATRVARWNFNQNGISTTAPAPSEVLTTGSAALLASVVGSIPSGSFADPAINLGLLNNGWGTATYPTNGNPANNKTGGVQFNVDTTGYKDIVLTWEERHSTTASKYTRVQYSPDGFASTTNDFQVNTMESTNNSTFVFYSCNLSGISSVNNNPSFAFRIVTEFAGTATNGPGTTYVATATGSSYAASGTIRFDLMSVFGNSLGTVSPIPLHVQYTGGNVLLSWSSASFRLQGSPEVTGAWTELTNNATSFNAGAPTPGGHRFYRLINP